MHRLKSRRPVRPRFEQVVDLSPSDATEDLPGPRDGHQQHVSAVLSSGRICSCVLAHENTVHVRICENTWAVRLILIMTFRGYGSRMNIQGRVRTRPVCAHAMRSHRRGRTHRRRRVLSDETYSAFVRTEEDNQGRKLAFARFVTKTMDDYRAERSLTVRGFVQLLDGVSLATIYRWRAGTWESDLEPEKVDAYCRLVGQDPQIAHRLLGWGIDKPERLPTAPTEEDPDLLVLARKLRDPVVPEAEKLEIRRLVRWLAARPPTSEGDQERPTG